MSNKNEQSAISECPICSIKSKPQEIEWVSKSVMDSLENTELCDHNESFICRKFINKSGEEIRIGRRKKFNGYFKKPEE